MKKYFKKIGLIFGSVWLVYAAIILGCKFTYDHPHVAPLINDGKIDDWQYTPRQAYVYEYKTPAQRIFSRENVSAHPWRYLWTGLVIEAIATALILMTWRLITDIKKSWVLLRSKEKADRIKARYDLFVLVPAATFVVFMVALVMGRSMYRYGGWAVVMALLTLVAIVTWWLTEAYLFFSGIFNWGSENQAIKKIGKKKFGWSLVHAVLAFCVWAVYNLTLTIAFGSSNITLAMIDAPSTNNSLQVKSFTSDSASTMNLANLAPTSANMGTSAIAPMAFLGSAAMESVSFEGDDYIGLAVGGANDVENFRENIRDGYLPEPTDLSYEGLFYDYYFDTGLTETCDKLFCPSYTSAISSDPYTGEDEYYLSVGLNSGIKESDFARKNLNLMVVLDISGSMSSRFDSYYYDGNYSSDDNRSKMEIANETITNLMDHLQDEDRFAVVLFDGSSYLAKPFRKVKDTDMLAIKKHVLEIEPQGSTNMSAGIEEALKEFEKLNLKDENYENRIIFLTDAMPNTGETSESGLFGKIRKASLDRIYTTFVGVGVDLNTELISDLTEVRGANYYAVHSALDFKRRLDDEFEFMVTPLVFNLDLTVDAPGYEIMQVYGSPEADQATGRIMTVNTLFPSASEGGENKGGLILLQLRRRVGATNDTIRLRASYEDRNGHRDSDEKIVTFASEPEVYPNTGILKGIVLTRYVSVLKDWMLAERYDDLELARDKVKFANMGTVGADYYLIEGIRPVSWPVRDGQWERGSQPLMVDPEYVTVFQKLHDYMSEQLPGLHDDTITQELDILDLLILLGQEKGVGTYEPTGLTPDQLVQLNQASVSPVSFDLAGVTIDGE